MDEFSGHPVGNGGIDRANREKMAGINFVGINFNVLVTEGPADPMRPFLATLARAEALMRKAASENAGMAPARSLMASWGAVPAGWARAGA